MTSDTLRDRVSSVCATLGYLQAQTPFSFELQPSGQIDGVYRVESRAGTVLGGFNWSEERTDLVSIWIARAHKGTPNEVYRSLSTEVNSVRAAVLRDGIQTSGEYFVPDGDWDWEIQREAGSAFAVLRVQLAANYEATV